MRTFYTLCFEPANISGSVRGVQLSWRLAMCLGFILLSTRCSHHTLNSSQSGTRAPQRLSQSTSSSLPHMEVVSGTSTIVGLAIPVFNSAKELRDRIKLVRYPPHPLCILRALMMILNLCLQVASEKAELLSALTEYEKDINLLESLYNDNKELLDQHRLDTDLKELAEYAWFCFLSHSSLMMAQNPTRP